MPRGRKTCPKCKAENGPRAWNCSSCGHGFTLRGVKKPDLNVTANPARSDAAKPDPKQRLWNLVTLYEGDDEIRARGHYQMEGRTWQSKCGHYRIREQFTFMGINLREHFSRCVYLLKLDRIGWNVIQPKGKFKTPLAAIRRMLKDSNGEKAKATTRAEKLEVRVSKITKRKTNYA